LAGTASRFEWRAASHTKTSPTPVQLTTLDMDHRSGACQERPAKTARPHVLHDNKRRRKNRARRPACAEKSASEADILHWACHGGGWPDALSYGEDAPRRLIPGQARTLRLRHRTVVFANACGSAVPTLVLAQVQTFGREFYIAGAALL